MNKISNNLSAILLAAVAAMPLFSCDDIAEADRIIAGTPNAYDRTFDNSQIVVDGETFNVNTEHTMLLVDFTGWLCINCPNIAGFLTKKITPVYPSVLVSMHMTTNSFSTGHIDGYNCPSADSIANWIYGSAIASSIGLPAVSVDNCTYNDKTLNNDSIDIEKLVTQRFKACNVEKTTAQASLSVNVHEQGEGQYEISTLVINPKAKDCTLRLWLIEEGLISTSQASTKGHIPGYENHGIMRQVINGAYTGQNLSLNEQGQGVLHTKLNIKDKPYKPENCYVVAVLTDVNGKEIVNCAKAQLVK